MCQAEILNLLKTKERDEYVTTDYMERKLKLSRQSIQEGVKRLRKHNEIVARVCWFKYGYGYVVKLPEFQEIKI